MESRQTTLVGDHAERRKSETVNQVPVRRSERPLWPHTATTACRRVPAQVRRRQPVIAVGWAVLLVVIVVLSAWAHHSLSASRQASQHAAAAQPASSISPPLPALPVGPQLRAWFTDAKPSIIAMFIAADNFVTAARYGDIAGRARVPNRR